jgi:hypothetical protein
MGYLELPENQLLFISHPYSANQVVIAYQINQHKPALLRLPLSFVLI